MPPPIKFEAYEVIETRGDGRLSPVREVTCFYRVHDGHFLWMRDPMLEDLLAQDRTCQAVRRRGPIVGIGYSCVRPAGHQGQHAALNDGDQSVIQAWCDADCVPPDAPSGTKAE